MARTVIGQIIASIDMLTVPVSGSFQCLFAIHTVGLNIGHRTKSRVEQVDIRIIHNVFTLVPEAPKAVEPSTSKTTL